MTGENGRSSHSDGESPAELASCSSGSASLAGGSCWSGRGRQSWTTVDRGDTMANLEQESMSWRRELTKASCAPHLWTYAEASKWNGEWPISGSEVQSLDPHSAEIASFGAALATNKALAQLDEILGGGAVVHSEAKDSCTCRCRQTMETLKTSKSAVWLREAEHAKISQLVAPQSHTLENFGGIARGL